MLVSLGTVTPPGLDQEKDPDMPIRPYGSPPSSDFFPIPGSERVVLLFNFSSFYQALAEIHILFSAFLVSKDLVTPTACWEHRDGHPRCVCGPQARTSHGKSP